MFKLWFIEKIYIVISNRLNLTHKEAQKLYSRGAQPEADESTALISLCPETTKRIINLLPQGRTKLIVFFSVIIR